MKFFIVDGNTKISSDYIMAVQEKCEDNSHNVYLILTDQSKHRIVSFNEREHSEAMNWLHDFCNDLERMKNEKNK